MFKAGSSLNNNVDFSRSHLRGKKAAAGAGLLSGVPRLEREGKQQQVQKKYLVFKYAMIFEFSVFLLRFWEIWGVFLLLVG